MARLEHIPAVGEETQVAGRTLRVEELDGRRVAAVRLLPPERATARADGALPGAAGASRRAAGRLRAG